MKDSTLIVRDYPIYPQLDFSLAHNDNRSPYYSSITLRMGEEWGTICDALSLSMAQALAKAQNMTVTDEIWEEVVKDSIKRGMESCRMPKSKEGVQAIYRAVLTKACRDPVTGYRLIPKVSRDQAADVPIDESAPKYSVTVTAPFTGSSGTIKEGAKGKLLRKFVSESGSTQYGVIKWSDGSVTTEILDESYLHFTAPTLLEDIDEALKCS